LPPPGRLRTPFQALPVDFCNQNSPRAQPLDRPIPIRSCRHGSPSLRRADGVEAPSTASTAGSGGAHGFGPSPGPRGPDEVLSPSTSRGFTSQGSMSILLAGASRFSSPCGARRVHGPKAMHAHESFSPTRSARTPHVTTSPHHRLEADDALRTMPPHELLPSRKGSSSWAPVRPARAGRPRRPFRSPFDGSNGRSRRTDTTSVTIHSRGSDSAVRHGPGPRVASPVAPRRAAGSAAPEVPSIDEPPVPDVWLAPGIVALAGLYPQVVTNLWIALGALFTSAACAGPAGPSGLTT
jgi:hypothetical protein